MSRMFSPLSWRLEHRYISITPAMSQRRDRYPLHAKAALCHACHNALRLTRTLESKGIELLSALPEPFLSLHLRFEPDTVAYSQCQYSQLSPSSQEAIEAARGDRKPWTGNAARVWRKPWTNCLHSQLARYPNTQPYINGLMETEGFISVYTNVYPKAPFLSGEDFAQMHTQRPHWITMFQLTVMLTLLLILGTWIKWCQ